MDSISQFTPDFVLNLLEGHTDGFALILTFSNVVIALSSGLVALTMLHIACCHKKWEFRPLLMIGSAFTICLLLTYILKHSYNIQPDLVLLRQLIVPITAMLGLGTSILLWRLIPTILSLPNSRELRETNSALRRTEQDLSQTIFWLEQRIEERTRELEALSLTDPLTRVLNRRGLMDKLEEEQRRSTRYKTPLSVLMIDLDNFKHINDHYGHQAGDAVLVRSAERIMDICRSTDFVGRFGGEEFLIVLTNTNAEKARQMAQRLCADIASQQVFFENQVIHFTCSIGVATQASEQNIDELVGCADHALYSAKHSGKNRIMVGCM